MHDDRQAVNKITSVLAKALIIFSRVKTCITPAGNARLSSIRLVGGFGNLRTTQSFAFGATCGRDWQLVTMSLDCGELACSFNKAACVKLVRGGANTIAPPAAGRRDAEEKFVTFVSLR